MPYRAPIEEFRFLFDHVVGMDQVRATARFAEATRELTLAILTEAGRLSQDVLAPLQRSGDLHPAMLENGVVRTSPGFAEGYRAIAKGGWISTSANPAMGGMGLPLAITTAVNEMMSSACLSLQLNPLMTQGQIEALEHHADDALKQIFLPRLIAGQWSGTMNLTEPQAGSDVGALIARAERQDDGTCRVTGRKIFISWGDSDFTSNVCHLVLARLPDGAPGTGGLSLFIVPKYLPDSRGEAGAANSLRVVSLERKLGLHGSPTAVMEFDGATGWLVGAEHGGMAAMFTMMNNARLGVGVQGIGVAEGALQLALDHARTRRQGRSPAQNGTGTILDHADVRRMLMTMRTETAAARAIALANAVALDMAGATGVERWKARAAFLTPISKAHGTDTGNMVAQLGVQVHGGMGFVEETGAAQYARDVRVTSIYEGTNGIQAMDLVGRKLMDGGAAACCLLDEVDEAAERARATLPELAQAVRDASGTLRATTRWMVGQSDLNERFAGAVPYLGAFARVLGAHYHLASALAESGGPRYALARFFITRLLPDHATLCTQARAGAADLYALTAERFSG